MSKPIAGCKNVVVIVTSAAGGATDTNARQLAEGLRQEWSLPVLVEPKPGANGAIAYGAYEGSNKKCSLLMTTNGPATAGAGGLEQPNAIDLRKLEPLGMTGRNAMYFAMSDKLVKRLMAVDPAIKAMKLDNLSLDDRKKIFAALVKLSAAPGEAINFGSAGTGSVHDLAMREIGAKTGLKYEHIPFKGSNPAAVALAGGHVDLLLDNPHNVSIYGNKPGFVVLASTAPAGKKIAGELGKLPTLSEVAGQKLVSSGWFGALGSGENAAAFRRAIEKVVATPGFQKKLEATGYEPGGDAAEMKRTIEEELKGWAPYYAQARAEIKQGR